MSNLRSIIVTKYENDIDDPNNNLDFVKKVQVGYLNDLITATATVNNFGDPQISVVCGLNSNNYRVAQNTYILNVKYDESSGEAMFVINNVKLDTMNSVITIIAEPIANELRNGVGRPDRNYQFNSNPVGISLMLQRVNNWRSRFLQIQVDSFTLPWQLGTKSRNGLELLGGTEFSALDLYGGEFKKHNYTITHRQQLGNPNRNYRLKLGVNVRGMNVTLDTSQVVNGCFHYYSYNDPALPTTQYIYMEANAQVDLPAVKIGDKMIRSGKTITKDWGEYAEILGTPPDTPISTVRSRMNSEIAKWTTANKNLNDPKIDIELDFYTLKDSIGFEDFDSLLTLSLGDSVLYYHEPLDWEISARVNGYVYNILTDRMDKLSIGNGKRTILDRIKGDK